MKVLLSAFACEPGFGSEEGVGWQTAVEAAKRHEVWVLTRGYCETTIAPYLAKHPITNLHFIYFEPFGWTEDWKGRQGFLTLHYYLWQIWAYFVARKLHNKIHFDVAHHVTYCRYWNPSFISLLSIPFLFGPVGGGESAPRSFQSTFSQRGRVYEWVRDLARSIGQCDPFLWLTLGRAKVAIATTPETGTRLRKLGARDVRVDQSLGLSTAEIDTLAQSPPSPEQPIRFLTVSRLIHWKGLHLSLRALAQAQLPDAEYWIIGQGVEQKRLETLVQMLELTQQVKFLGILPRPEVMNTMGQCHVLVHPSLHESGGFVCAEMMAAGRPVLCFNLGGPAVQVTNATGRVVTAHNPGQAIADLAAAMVELANDAHLRQTLGQAGQKRVKALYDWSVKGDRLSQIYQEISHIK